jgi:hypothetical protein
VNSFWLIVQREKKNEKFLMFGLPVDESGANTCHVTKCLKPTYLMQDKLGISESIYCAIHHTVRDNCFLHAVIRRSRVVLILESGIHLAFNETKA